MDTSNIDLIGLIAQHTTLKKVASTKGGEWHGACPFCGGDDRFSVQPHRAGGGRWSCRGCSPHWRDAIAFVQCIDNMDFKGALAVLGLSGTPPPRRKPTLRRRLRRENMPANLGDYIALSNSAYQSAATEFCQQAEETLHNPEGQRAREWLTGRGIKTGDLELAGLGFNSQETNANWGGVKVWLPRGIVIPWLFGGQVWKVNFRRPTGEPKYIAAKGAANGLYFGRGYHYSPIKPDSRVILTEGEFDALALRGNCVLLGSSWVVVSTGTASGARVKRWVWDIASACQILLAFDADPAGDAAAAWWASQPGFKDKAIRLRPTHGKDLTDQIKAVGDLTDWILDTMDAHFAQVPIG